MDPKLPRIRSYPSLLYIIIYFIISYFENDEQIPFYCHDAPSYSIERALEIILTTPPTSLCSKQPIYVTESSTFVVDCNKLDHRDDICADDLCV